ncbi:Hypothetical Protein FCC1311_068262 [Hondaea fermentalgiana]|uniref:WRKY19-like zinc finger domain-containing protein n=1 Tax=Hondaea fermentalgiana TaxID=2315210 RepID=A0A2R5GI81_9STRA|nr:Hypothetical Protein FCC1311_068262 [Hondaea fermentalgiana]|eukprot:GBG30606.1 Hypothetical Protein FCC1311_068262 [Hondaea fermentalgiana]
MEGEDSTHAQQQKKANLFSPALETHDASAISSAVLQSLARAQQDAKVAQPPAPLQPQPKSRINKTKKSPTSVEGPNTKKRKFPQKASASSASEKSDDASESDSRSGRSDSDSALTASPTRRSHGKRCRHPGCHKFYRSGSHYCVSHGGGRRCKHDGCEKSAQGATPFCSAHGGGKRCQFPDCTKGARGRSLFCIAHNTQVKKLQSPEAQEALHSPTAGLPSWTLNNQPRSLQPRSLSISSTSSSSASSLTSSGPLYVAARSSGPASVQAGLAPRPESVSALASFASLSPPQPLAALVSSQNAQLPLPQLSPEDIGSMHALIRQRLLESMLFVPKDVANGSSKNAPSSSNNNKQND